MSGRWSSTVECKAALVADGWPLVEIVERRVMGGRMKFDFMGKGGADVLAYDPVPGRGWKAVNGCTLSRKCEHIRQALANPRVRRWVEEWGFKFSLLVFSEAPEREGGDEGHFEVPYELFRQEMAGGGRR